jgi:hypothetical protein
MHIWYAIVTLPLLLCSVTLSALGKKHRKPFLVLGFISGVLCFLSFFAAHNAVSKMWALKMDHDLHVVQAPNGSK